MKKIRKPKADLEHKEQVKFVFWASWLQIRFWQLDTLYAVPNQGDRCIQELNFLSSEGLKKGVPDLALPYASHGYHGLYIEMKYGKNTLQDMQLVWKARLERNGYKHIVPYSSKEAIVETMNYICPYPEPYYTIENMLTLGLVLDKHL